MKELSFMVKGMHCESCEKIIKMELDDMPTVLESKINAKTGEAIIKVEDTETSQNIVDAIGRAGYKAEVVERG